MQVIRSSLNVNSSISPRLINIKLDDITKSRFKCILRLPDLFSEEVPIFLTSEATVLQSRSTRESISVLVAIQRNITPIVTEARTQGNALEDIEIELDDEEPMFFGSESVM
ncbi:hypothetical protein Ciccas_014159 [Cichlidogyrus casuarinus]|uniref:Uncharacterized protein n=1 Tax=Cichlidogyrus casuarinus TaxID=1844966 RepID=A0ABD2PLP3_9PLAT